MTIQEIDQLGDKILNEHGINNAKNLGLRACHEALRLAVELESSRTIPMETKLLQEIEQSCKATTGGKWVARQHGPSGADESTVTAFQEEGAGCQPVIASGITGSRRKEDSEFIAKSHQWIPDLLTELSHAHKETAILWKALDEARAEVERLQKERDTAVADIETMARDRVLGTCTFCKHRDNPDFRFKPCNKCHRQNGSKKSFEWRGPQEPTP